VTPKPRPRWRRSLRAGLLLVALPALGIGSLVAWRRASGNIGIVEPGRIYRSAQLDAKALGRLIRAHGIKTVLNLRGPNPDQAWYRAEVTATLDAGATLIDIPLASDQWLSTEQARTIVETLDSCAYPILIHCEFGAERTGLVSALAVWLRPGRTFAQGRDQFALGYLFLPVQDGLVMLGHADRYAAWLREQGLDHSPAHLRRWLAEAYRPGTPSREYWPCDPYPRLVVTDRAPDGTPRRRVVPSPRACPRTVATGANVPARR
jgi:protein tyrosine phosphatase (PTP) superfamily phosphohydrolase (DUF442 family)